MAGCAAPTLYFNTPLEDYHRTVPRAGFPSSLVNSCDGSKSDDLDCKNDVGFVGIAISGGGSRASNYSAAVMSELDRIGILKHVNAISSVSGGSLAAAYYVSRSSNPLRLTDKKLFWDTAKKDLSKDFRSAYVAKFLRPDNFWKSMFGPVGRTEVMAQVFDEYIFSGLRFGDLDILGPRLIINATAINNFHGIFDETKCTNRRTYAASMKGESISFTEDFFNHCLFSTTSTYPLSHAVAASAAFPGIFSSVPLARFGWTKDFEKPIPLEYLHLIDGGPSDNLGIDGILSGWAARSRQGEKPGNQQCLIMVIDAFASGEIDLRNMTPDPRAVIDRFVDSNFFDSIDAMLSRRRLETLKNLKLPPPESRIDKIRVENFPSKEHSFSFGASKTVVEKVNPFEVLGKDQFGSMSNRTLGPECMIWYIGIDSIKNLVAPDWEFGYEPDLPYISPRGDEEYRAVIDEHFSTQEAKNRMSLWDLSSRVKTDFNLVGPKNCSSKVLSDVLWSAGTYSVSADVESRRKVCSWFRKAGMPTSDICAEPVAVATPNFPIKYVDHPNNDYSVECE